MSDEQPPEKKTVEFARPPDWAIALTEKVTTGFAAVESRLDTMETNIEIQGDSVKNIAGRMTSLEARVGRVEERQETNSVRAKSTTETDHQQDAAIAQILVDVQGLKETQTTQLAILHRLDAIAANPMVRRVAYAIGGAVLAYLSAKGMLAK